MQREFNISLSQEFYSDTVYLSQYDSDYDIVFHVKNKYAAVNVNNLAAKLTGLRPPAPGSTERLGFEFTSTGSGTDVTFHIDNTVSAVAGTGTGEIVFTDANDMVFGSANVQIIVEPAAHPNDAIDADVEEEQALADEIREMIEGIDDVVETVTSAKNTAVAAASDAEDAKDAAVTAKTDAQAAKTAADTDALKAEGYAVGKQNGTAVSSNSPYYHNNAAYFADQAGDSADAAAASATAAAQSAASLTVDSALSSSSTNPVQNKVINAAVNSLMEDLSAETVNRTNEDNLLQSQIDEIIAPTGEAPSAAEVTNARIGANGVTYNTLGNAIRNQIEPLQDVGVVNLFEPFFYNATVSGVSFVFNDSDNTYNISGTATENAYPEIGRITLPAGTYKLLSLSEAGSATTFRTNLYVASASTMVAQDMGNGYVFTLDSTTTLRLVLYINSGTTMNIVYKPMITKSTWATINEYVPYIGEKTSVNGDLAETQHQLFKSKLTGDKSHNNDVGWLVDVAKTWTDNASLIWYSYDGNLFKPNVIETDGKYPMTCSVFAAAMLFGITFYNSKYNSRSTNIENECGYKDSNLLNLLSTATSFTSSDFAKYCVDKGYMFVPEPNLENVQMGDVLFVNNQASDGRYFYNCDHMAIMAYKTSATYVVWEVGDNNGPVQKSYNLSSASKVKFVARFPYNQRIVNTRAVYLPAAQFTSATPLTDLFDFKYTTPNGTANMWKVTLLGTAYGTGAAHSSIYLIRTNASGTVTDKAALYEGTGAGARKLDSSYRVYDAGGTYNQPVTVICEWLGC